MATIKSFTSLEQSKKLAEILPLESADMFIFFAGDKEIIRIHDRIEDYKNWEPVSVWSLAALLSVLPKIGAEEPMVRKLYYASKPVERYICEYGLTNMTSEYDNPVDACVAMIEKLHELKML